MEAARSGCNQLTGKGIAAEITTKNTKYSKDDDLN